MSTNFFVNLSIYFFIPQTFGEKQLIVNSAHRSSRGGRGRDRDNSHRGGGRGEVVLNVYHVCMAG